MLAARADRAVGASGTAGPSRPEAGVVIIWFLLGLTAFLGICGFAVDIGNWFYQAERLQKAADTAALAGVVSLPGDPNTATATVRATTAQNGLTNGVGGVAVSACPGQTTICAASLTPTQASQLAVIVSK